MTIRNRWRIGLAGIGALLLACSVWAWNREGWSGQQSFVTTPADVAALRGLEECVQSMARNVAFAVVAVESPVEAPEDEKGYASGVIISAEGVVLSQGHVSHRYPFHGHPGEQDRYRRPGETTSVILHDGRAVPAELLGADQTYDFSLLRLLEPGPYPFIPLEPKSEVELGDWVLKLGHPTGYRRDRPTVVRLGRVVAKEESLFVTDCHTTGGDSGGPYFDLGGRLIGLIGSDQIPLAFRNVSLSRPAYLHNCDSSSFIQSFLPSMLHSEITTGGRSDKVERVIRLTKSQNNLHVNHWTQGATTAAAFQAIAGLASSQVVEIQDANKRQVALGTIVGADGWIVTVNSLLPSEPWCRLPNGQVVSAELIEVNRDFDLALLKVPGSNLCPVVWATDNPDTRVGTILAAPHAVSTPDRPLLGIGIVSVATRNLPGPYPDHRSHAQINTRAPGLGGMQTDHGFRLDWIDDNDFSALDSGIRRRDILTAIDNKMIRTNEDIQSVAEGRTPGDQVVVRVLRNGQPMEFSITLRAMPITWTKPYGNLPKLFEHDMPLPPHQCGGPVLNLNGKAVGITVFRGNYGCRAIPADCIERLLPELLAQALDLKEVQP